MLKVSTTDAAARERQIDHARTQAVAGNLAPLSELKSAYDKLDLDGNLPLNLSALSIVDLWVQYGPGLQA